MITVVGQASLQGLKTRPCEDRYRLLDDRVPLVANAGRGVLYAVIDGMGSAPKALHAAQHVADRLPAFFGSGSGPASAEELHGLLQEVNREIHGWGTVGNSDLPLGAAAATVVWLSPARELVVFQCEDTMAYRFDGTLTRLAHAQADGGALTSYLGMGPGCSIRVERFGLNEGDLVCLVTDGVTTSMSEEQIAAVLAAPLSPERTAQELVRQSRQRGSSDDITAVVVELEDWEDSNSLQENGLR